ncbi:MAG: antibiotic biosynthesis monooxygenase [Desulfobacteraceae bacterium]|nr:antibiotic biosynthesis monooxygenase [Desulfobacteraceae bacterium]
MIVVAKLKAKSGKAEEMEKTLREMVSKVEQEEGTLAYTLHRSQNDPTLFLLYERYQDKNALDFHSATPYFKELLNVMGPLLDGAPGIEMYDEIARMKK